MPNVLVTGGAGFIGAHCCVALIAAGIRPVILDNLSNSSPVVIDRIENIAGVRPAFVHADVRDTEAVQRALEDHEITAVIHFAALKAVGKSVEKPLEYFNTNVYGTLCLLDAMQKCGKKTFVFSSSATVYAETGHFPIKEDFPRAASNPYGRTKLVVEDILEDLVRSEPDWRIARLRYFNPIGAHESGLIGEDPKGTPNNLMPNIAQVAVGKREQLLVYGNDYPTRDGSGVRDYIHVMDLVEGHVAALNYLDRQEGLLTVNLGTGKGYSVLEVIRAFERANDCRIPFKVAARRAGDIAEYWADPTLAFDVLGWRATRSLEAMCSDSWQWQKNNPDGYGIPD